MIETDRLIIRTNCKVIDGVFTYPETKPFVSLLKIDPQKPEDTGFGLYLKTGELVGHIDVTFKRERFELSVGTFEQYQRHGYMTEAQMAIVPWIFANCNTDTIWAVLGGITDDASRKILERTGFKRYGDEKSEWWVIKRTTENMQTEIRA